jgi:hypothetical protein
VLNNNSHRSQFQTEPPHGLLATRQPALAECKIISFIMSEIVDNVGRSPFTDGDDDGAALERRLFRGMCVAVALALSVSLALAPWRVTTGLLLGGILSFFNHHWLRHSLGAVFGGAAARRGGGGGRPRLGAARYVVRYVIIAAIVAAAYWLDLVSIAATIAGLCSFAAAIMIEALTQLYFAIVYREEN